MIRKVLCLQYSEDNIGGEFEFLDCYRNVTVEITSSKLEYTQFLNIRLNIGLCFKLEILNAKDKIVFHFIYKDRNANGRHTTIKNFCNLTVLKNGNSDLFSRKSEDSLKLPPYIKMVLTIGREDQLLRTSSETNINDLSPIEMLRFILNETAFDDPEIEAEEIGTLIESSVDKLRRVIKVENAANILRLAQKYNVESLKEVAVKFVADNIHEVMKTNGWYGIPEKESKQLLSTVLLSLNPRKNVEAEQD